MRLTAVPFVVATLLLVPAGAAVAAGTPYRAEVLVPVAPSGNGGDNGWGNCGHNSSGGAAHSGTQGQGGGNGGYRRGDCTGPAGGGGDEGADPS